MREIGVTRRLNQLCENYSAYIPHQSIMSLNKFLIQMGNKNFMDTQEFNERNNKMYHAYN